MEEPIQKKSPYELPEGLGFKAGDAVQLKSQPGKQWVVMGYLKRETKDSGTKERVRLIRMGKLTDLNSTEQPVLEIGPEELALYELATTGHPLEALVE